MPLLTLNELEQMAPFFRGRIGNALAGGLMKLLNVDSLNALYDRNSQTRGADFASDILNDIGLKYRLGFSYPVDISQPNAVAALKAMLPDTAFITISNHPCGHVDGVCLVDIFGHIRSDYKVMVNEILSRVENLSDNFISVTPTGNRRTAPTVTSISGIKTALTHLRAGGCLGLFPSGAVSDLSLRDGCVRDRDWQEAIVRLIRKARVPILPVRFFDGNSRFYYSLGLIDWKVRLLRLPSEVFNKGGKPFRVGIGPVITVEEQDGIRDFNAFKAFLRSSVYDMPCPDVFAAD